MFSYLKRVCIQRGWVILFVYVILAGLFVTGWWYDKNKAHVKQLEVIKTTGQENLTRMKKASEERIRIQVEQITSSVANEKQASDARREEQKAMFLQDLRRRQENAPIQRQEMINWLFSALPGLKRLSYGEFIPHDFEGYKGVQLFWNEEKGRTEAIFHFENVVKNLHVRILFYSEYGLYLGEVGQYLSAETDTVLSEAAKFALSAWLLSKSNKTNRNQQIRRAAYREAGYAVGKVELEHSQTKRLSATATCVFTGKPSYYRMYVSEKPLF